MIVTYEDLDLYPYIRSNDKTGYIEKCVETKTTTKGKSPTQPVASRWFNLHRILGSTEGDLWLHREKNLLWWTFSKKSDLQISREVVPDPRGDREVYLFSKLAEPWSNETMNGNRLEWSGLHAKAREFLFTESTLQKLRPENAEYAVALVEGEDLSRWHNQSDWNRKAETAGRHAAVVYNSKEKAIFRMANMVSDTVRAANGQQVLQTRKEKSLSFTKQELVDYIRRLAEEQQGRCAITGLPLQYDGDVSDINLLCSLDRIDSDRHYEPENLQIVCRFVNRWKGDSPDEEFRRLIDLVRSEGAPTTSRQL